MTVKDAYSLPQIQETLECLWGAVWFTSLDLKLGYWQVRMKEECKAYTAFTVGIAWVLQMQMHAIQVNKCTCHLSMFNGDMFGGSPVELVHHLPRQHNCLCHNPEGTLGEATSGLHQIEELGLNLSPRNVNSSKWRLCIGPCSVQAWSPNGWAQDRGCEEVAYPPDCNRGQVLPGVCQLLPLVPEGVCLSHPSIVWVGFRRKCKQEKQAGAVDQQCQEAFEKIKDLCCTATHLGLCRLQTTLHPPHRCQWDWPGAVLYQVIDGQECVIGYRSHSE